MGKNGRDYYFTPVFYGFIIGNKEYVRFFVFLLKTQPVTLHQYWSTRSPSFHKKNGNSQPGQSETLRRKKWRFSNRNILKNYQKFNQSPAKFCFLFRRSNQGGVAFLIRNSAMTDNWIEPSLPHQQCKFRVKKWEFRSPYLFTLTHQPF